MWMGQGIIWVNTFESISSNDMDPSKSLLLLLAISQNFLPQWLSVLAAVSYRWEISTSIIITLVYIISWYCFMSLYISLYWYNVAALHCCLKFYKYHCLLFTVKNFHCSTSLLSFPKNIRGHQLLQAFIVFTCKNITKNLLWLQSNPQKNMKVFHH